MPIVKFSSTVSVARDKDRAVNAAKKFDLSFKGTTFCGHSSGSVSVMLEGSENLLLEVSDRNNLGRYISFQKR